MRTRLLHNVGIMVTPARERESIQWHVTPALTRLSNLAGVDHSVSHIREEHRLVLSIVVNGHIVDTKSASLLADNRGSGVHRVAVGLFQRYCPHRSGGSKQDELLNLCR